MAPELFQVTDLSAPGFCEVKHRYNLFGKRHLAPDKRPVRSLPRSACSPSLGSHIYHLGVICRFPFDVKMGRR